MSIEPIGFLTILVGFAMLALPLRFACIALALSTLLQSSATVIIPGLASIPPAHFLLGFVILLAFRHRSVAADALRALRTPNAGFWLLLTWLYGCASAIFLPRLLAGQFQVNAVSAAAYSNGFFYLPLGPSTGNFTQPIYFTGDLLCFMFFVGVANRYEGFVDVKRALIAYGIANAIFAAIDIVTTQTGQGWLLEFIRNGNYAIYTDSDVGGAKRIIGSFTEASGFAYATIGIFCFSTRLWLGNISVIYTASLSVASLLLICFSTSSTGYVALLPCLAIICIGAFYRIARSEGSSADAGFVFIVPCLAIAAVSLLVLDQHMLEILSEFFDVTLFNKSLSASGLDRARLNSDAYDLFVNTFGLGTGLGSARSSSFVLACLSNLGAIGSALFMTFGAFCFCQPRDRGENPGVATVQAAARLGCCGILIAAAISGALVDLGLPFFIFAALSCARPYDAERVGYGRYFSGSRPATVSRALGSTCAPI